MENGTLNLVLGVFMAVVLVVLVFAIYHDWDGDTPGRQNFMNRKRR